MATDHLAIPDILSNQDNKEVTANAATNLLDRAISANVALAVASGLNTLTTTQARENVVIELTGTPGAVLQLRMPDTNKRMLTVVNNSDDVCTVENSAGAGTGQPVISVGEASIFHYDGTNFIDITSLAITEDVSITQSTIATLQTTDATVTDIATIAIASGETAMVRGFGVAQGPSTASVGFEFIGTAHNAAGTTTLTGQTVRTHDDQVNSYALTIDADDTGDTLRIRATGIAATTIDWRISYETVVEA